MGADIAVVGKLHQAGPVKAQLLQYTNRGNIVLGGDCSDAMQAKFAARVIEHGGSGLGGQALAASYGQEGVAKVHILQELALHKAGHAHGHAVGFAFGQVHTESVGFVTGIDPIAHVLQRLLFSLDTAVGNIGLEVGIGQHVPVKCSIAVDKAAQSQMLGFRDEGFVRYGIIHERIIEDCGSLITVRELNKMPNPQASESPYVLRELSAGICWLTLNRPKQRNPLSSSMIAAIKQHIDAAAEDPQVRVIVLAGSGPVFSAGHDLAEMGGPIPDGYASRDELLRAILSRCKEMMLAIMHSPKAVIASVQGTATAAGCQLVSACDLAIAADDAHFCTPGVNIGSFCTTPLVGIGRNMHRKHAMELALTGDMFTAEDAVRMGLINRAVASSELRTEVEQLAQKIASKSAQGIRDGKKAFYQQIDMPVESAFDYASEEMIKAFSGADAKEGIAAFFEKRAPQWGDA